MHARPARPSSRPRGGASSADKEGTSSGFPLRCRTTVLAYSRMPTSVLDKVKRLRIGCAPRVLDLFSGCGGLMLGFDRAGCESVAGVDLDIEAARSYAFNFHGGDPAHCRSRDITKLDPAALLRSLRRPEGSVDIIIGGPPCPAFTRVGRAKLREVRSDPKAHIKDPRARLYRDYLRFVRDLAPVALVMENVPDILNFGGRNLGEEIAETLEDEGYQCRYSLLNAANHGVPQMRERFFLFAVHRSARTAITFPEPTHKVVFPSGYASSRRVALKHIPADDLLGPSRYAVTRGTPLTAIPGVTVRDAISDLPSLRGRDVSRRVQRLDGATPYAPKGRVSGYAEQMRTWPRFQGYPLLRDHVTRALSQRDFRLFEHMHEGDDYPKAVALAESLLQRALRRSMRGTHPAHEAELRRQYVPPYDCSTFPNRWRKMEADAPARTLMAHLGKDTYSHIHPDGEQARTITVREAARLQSFPDGFRFAGSMNAAFRQIGNAVPPLLAFAVAKTVMSSIGPSALALDASAEVA